MYIDIRKAKDKACVYELRVPSSVINCDESHHSRQSASALERQELQANLLGVQNISQLASEKLKSKVRDSKQIRQVKLGLSGDRLIVRFGSGFCDFIEYLERKGLLLQD
jgi:soluble cytochrome b562